MKKHTRFLLPALSAMLLLAAGCGYHMGSMMHPQIKTIGIAPVVNDTTGYNVSAEMRQLLSEQFMLDGSLKVVSEKTADCIVYTRVVNTSFTAVSRVSYNDDDDIYVPEEWKVEVSAEFTVLIPGRKEPLLSTRTVSGSSNFQSPGDMDAGRRRGVQQACREAARSIVSNTTEAW